MGSDYRCPFCGENCEKRQSEHGGNYFYIECENGFKCKIYNNVLSGNDDREIKKRFHQMYFFMKESLSITEDVDFYKYRFTYDEKLGDSEIGGSDSINVAELMKSYPKTFMDKMEKALYNLCKAYPDYESNITIEDFEMSHLLYCESGEEERIEEERRTLDLLCQLGYLTKKEDYFYISAKGREKLSELDKIESNNQGFIAMSFSDETKSISESFKNAISRCGYIPLRIDEKEHNNQIVPEILSEISRSKFVVVDVTVSNCGAYYEAGYAEALGKEVIICCRNDIFTSNKKPHFDIAQKSLIVWEDEEDLENRLYRRIEATVGLNK